MGVRFVRGVDVLIWSAHTSDVDEWSVKKKGNRKRQDKTR